MDVLKGESPLLAKLVREACEPEGWTMRPGTDEVVVVVPLDEERHQEVVVSQVDQDGVAVIRFHTVIGPVKDLTGARPHAALKLNFALPYGAFAIHGDDLVLCRLHSMKDLDPAETRSTIGYLGATGDRYEKHLYGTDVH